MLLSVVSGVARAVPLDAGYRVADACSAVHRWAAPGRRAAVAENLRILGAENPDDAVRSVFRNFGRTVFEFLRGPHVPELDVRILGWEHVETARAAGRGVIVTLPHAGNWEAGGAAVARQGVPVHAVAGIQLTRAWTPALRDRQARDGIRILPPTLATWRSLPRLLGQNELVALLVDGDVFRGGLPLHACGHRVQFPTGPAKLALRTGARIVPCRVVREADGRILVTLSAPFAVAEGPDAIARTSQAIMDETLRGLQADPGQWLLFRRFFAPEETGSEVAA